ncbi:unnamed protein product [Trichobilharzia szidati]|nr:unnamed protein product [Trichobilharzia szidati]
MSEAEVCEKGQLDDRKEVQDKLSIAKEWGSYFFSKAVKSSEQVVRNLANRIDLNEIKTAVSDVTSTVKQVPLIREFQQAQADFAEAHQSSQNETVDFHVSTLSDLPPWHPDVSGLSDPNAVSALKENILALSQNPNNFLIPPPEEAQLKWTTPIPQNLLHEAQILLKEDPNLSAVRYRLVPSKISEDIFWRNYFYRLSLIRQSAHLSAVMANSHPQNMTNSNVSSGGSDNGVSDTDFVCIEQNPIWSRGKTNSEMMMKETTSEGVSSKKSEKTKHSTTTKVKTSTPTTEQPSKKSTSSHSSPSSTTTTTMKKNKTKQQIDESQKSTKYSSNSPSNNLKTNSDNTSSTKSLEEQLEEEIAREVDELVLSKTEKNLNNSNKNNNGDDDSESDEIDEELELEILAELEGGSVNNRTAGVVVDTTESNEDDDDDDLITDDVHLKQKV